MTGTVCGRIRGHVALSRSSNDRGCKWHCMSMLAKKSQPNITHHPSEKERECMCVCV